MNCRRAQSDFSRSRDEHAALPADVARHFARCEDCAEFRETTVVIERRYRSQVLSGIDRLRRLDPPAFRTRRSLRARMVIPLAAAAVLACGWALAKGMPPVPAAESPAPTAGMPAKKARCLLFEEARLFGESGLELSFLKIGEPLLPVRLDQDLHGPGWPEQEIALPRNLRF